MPNLDVADVLSDPDFATTITVQRNTTVVGLNGEATQTPAAPVSIVAVVTPANSYDLKRMAEAERLSGGIAIHTTYALHAGGLLPDGVTSATADGVTWQGRQWTIFSVEDWTQFGAGFVRATATMLSLG